MPKPVTMKLRLNTTFIARFSATAVTPIFTGVAMSPRAKNPGATTFTSTNAGSPSA